MERAAKIEKKMNAQIIWPNHTPVGKCGQKEYQKQTVQAKNY